MRTTITINDELLGQVLKISKEKAYSKAVVASLQDYVALRKRMQLLDKLYTQRLPHSFKKIKKQRKFSSWSS